METPSENRPRGTASIKSEYIVSDHVRELNPCFVANTDKKEIVKPFEFEYDEPLRKKRKKLKGQNRNRPRVERVPKCEKLCFSLGTTGSCEYGSNCSYSHDVNAYMLNKPQDIGENCHFFETFGKCPYTFSCRFGSKHIVDGKNVIDEEKWNQFKDRKLVLNVLQKDIQKALRKHSYDFSRTEQALKTFTNQNANAQAPGKTDSAVPVEDHSNSDAPGTGQPSCKNEADRCLEENSNLKETVGAKLQPVQIDEDVTKLSPQTAKEEHGNPDAAGIHEPSCKSSETNSCLEGNSPVYESISAKPQPIQIDEDVIKLLPREVKKIDFRGKLYLAPLTTVGNLPFRRICKELGAEITCGEMAMASSILQGNQSEWALLKRHHNEDLFGIQLCGANIDVMTRCSQMLTERLSVDFIDINLGCPLDMIYKKGAGCGLMNRTKKLYEMVHCMSSVMDVPLTVKMRSGVHSYENIAHHIIDRMSKWDNCVSLITLHGRSREQRYTRSADWSYIDYCAEIADNIPLFGNGDVLSYEDYNLRMKETKVSGVMIARGALIKPWIFTEIKEQRHWDISSSERMDILKNYVHYGLEHWGSDTEGVDKTRRFLLEWLSFLHRYIPVGLLERVPQRINERPPAYRGRDDLETLMASPSCADWVKISEMLLGPVADNFVFLPKHKANAYE